MMKAEKTSHVEHSRSTSAVQGQSAGVYQKWRTLALARHLHIVPHGGTEQDTGQSLCRKKNSADTATTQTDILTTRALKGRRHQPVKLIDVLNVAEEGADLLWFERQVSTVNNAA